MTIKKGDKVKFLNDVGGGIVTELVDSKTVKVLNDTGFEIPVLIDELMPDYSADVYSENKPKVQNEENKNIFEEEPIYTENEDINIYSAFVPENQNRPEDGDIYVFLINDSNYFLQYNFLIKGEKKYKSINGVLEPNVKENIYNFENLMLTDNFEAIVQVLFYDKKEFDYLKPVHKEIKIRNVKFLRKGTYSYNDFFEESALLFPVFESNKIEQIIENVENADINKIIDQKEKRNKDLNNPKTSKKKEPKNIKEVDLHIHELLDDDSGMSDHDKLEYQLEVFHKEMKSAIKEGYRRIVFIHGVGSGSLKLKIRSELQYKYKQYQFQDASFKEYGYGATMVMLRK